MQLSRWVELQKVPRDGISAAISAWYDAPPTMAQIKAQDMAMFPFSPYVRLVEVPLDSSRTVDLSEEWLTMTPFNAALVLVYSYREVARTVYLHGTLTYHALRVISDKRAIPLAALARSRAFHVDLPDDVAPDPAVEGLFTWGLDFSDAYFRAMSQKANTHKLLFYRYINWLQDNELKHPDAPYHQRPPR